MQYALRQGHTVKQIAKMTSMDPWFLYQLKEINDMQLELEKHSDRIGSDRGAARGQAHGLLATGDLAECGGWKVSEKNVGHLRKKQA